MKNKIFCFLTALLLAVSAANLPVYAAWSAASPTVQEDFYRQLAGLVSKQDYSKFFDEMELRVGSDILTVDGETQVLTAAPEITNGRTMLPIRAVAEAAGAEVDWDAATSTVMIESASGDEISCSIGSQDITINDQTSQMDVTPYIKRDKTYMPIRAVAEALELDVDWEAATKTIRLTAPYQTARLIVLADQLDVLDLNAEAVISDGDEMWVLQFATPTQARNAAEVLEARGITVEPDLYIPPIADVVSSEQAAVGTHYSWGAGDCGFDGYVSKYAGKFTSNGVVAVVDTGVDSSHSFLWGRVLSGGYDFIDGDSTPNDGHSHGTHVAGTIIDCVGSAPVNILPVRVLNNQGSGTSATVAAGIKYAADHGADVINLSLGGGCSSVKDSAVSYAIGKGCLVVIAAGNDNTNTANTCPAHITSGGAVIVSAGDSGHNKASFSNYGSSVDLMAPGVSIKATIPGGGFGTMSGTSMAAPHAAAAAVLIDLAWGETLTPAALEKELYSATTYGKWTNSTVGCGFLDMSKASAPSKNITPMISLDRSSLSLKAGESQTLTASVTPSGTAVSWSSSNTKVATVSNGKVTAVSQGTATITAQIVYNGMVCQAKCTVTVAAEVKPEINLSHSSLSLLVGESQTLTVSVKPSGTAVSWSSSNTNVATIDRNGRITAVSSGSATITAEMFYGGRNYTATCRVTVTKASLGISVEAYNTTMNVGDTQTLRVITTEPNFESLVATSSNTSVATVDRNSGVVTAVGAGTTTITITISKTVNGRTISGSDSCTISVKRPTYTFGMQMTIRADDAVVSALKRAGFNMNAIVDTSGYTWRYNSDGYFHCDTGTSVSYNTLKTIAGMEFWEFQYSDLAAQLYPYDYGTVITTAVTSGQPNQYSLGAICIRGFSYPMI